MARCDARCLVWPEWIGDTGEVGIAECERDHDGHDEHEGRMVGFPTLITWFEDDRRTFRGELTYCDRGPGGKPCVLPAGHRSGCAF